MVAEELLKRRRLTGDEVMELFMPPSINALQLYQFLETETSQNVHT